MALLASVKQRLTPVGFFIFTTKHYQVLIREGDSRYQNYYCNISLHRYMNVAHKITPPLRWIPLQL